MMTRTIVLGAAMLLSARAAPAQQIYQLEGQITDALFLFPPASAGITGTVSEFPTPYTGTFNYDPANAWATFEFTATIHGEFATRGIGVNLSPGVVQNDAAALVVEYNTSPQIFRTAFALSLDKSTGQGEWQWAETCLPCTGVPSAAVDLIGLPYARATITSYRVVSEPTSLAIALLGLLGAVRRR
jgi:hypothetical protein